MTIYYQETLTRRLEAKHSFLALLAVIVSQDVYCSVEPLAISEIWFGFTPLFAKYVATICDLFSDKC